jgi:hypothetical protein
MEMMRKPRRRLHSRAVGNVQTDAQRLELMRGLSVINFAQTMRRGIVRASSRALPKQCDSNSSRSLGG